VWRASKIGSEPPERLVTLAGAPCALAVDERDVYWSVGSFPNPVGGIGKPLPQGLYARPKAGGSTRVVVANVYATSIALGANDVVFNDAVPFVGALFRKPKSPPAAPRVALMKDMQVGVSSLVVADGATFGVFSLMYAGTSQIVRVATDGTTDMITPRPRPGGDVRAFAIVHGDLVWAEGTSIRRKRLPPIGPADASVDPDDGVDIASGEDVGALFADADAVYWIGKRGMRRLAVAQ
jgi:hypothetical protein